MTESEETRIPGKNPAAERKEIFGGELVKRKWGLGVRWHCTPYQRPDLEYCNWLCRKHLVFRKYTLETLGVMSYHNCSPMLKRSKRY